MNLPEGFFWDEAFQLGRESAELTARLWPKYLTAESDIPEPGLQAKISRDELKRRFPAWGIRSADGRLAAFANGAHLWVDPTAAALPDTGWTYAIRSALNAPVTNAFCLLVANVTPEARGSGLAEILIHRAKQEAARAGYATMIAPVRPTHKHRAPFQTIRDYLDERTPEGEIQDPWIQVHLKAGAEIVNVCEESVRVRATLPKWREWTGLEFTDSGDQLAPKALVPIKVYVSQNMAEYKEPNVWMRYNF